MPLKIMQGEGLGYKCIRFFLCLLNFLLILFGVCLVGVGGAIQKNFSQLDESLADHTKAIKSVALLTVIVGLFMAFISLFGMFAVVKKNYVLVLTFAVMLGLMFVLEISACATAFALRENIKKYLHKEVVKIVQNFDMNKQGHVFNKIQQNFECCGWYGHEDYNNTAFEEQALAMILIKEVESPRIEPVPDSCCLNWEYHCGLELGNPVFDVGCVEIVTKKVKGVFMVMALIGVGVMLVQLVTIIFASFTARVLKIRYKK